MYFLNIKTHLIKIQHQQCFGLNTIGERILEKKFQKFTLQNSLAQKWLKKY